MNRDQIIKMVVGYARAFPERCEVGGHGSSNGMRIRFLGDKMKQANCTNFDHFNYVRSRLEDKIDNPDETSSYLTIGDGQWSFDNYIILTSEESKLLDDTVEWVTAKQTEHHQRRTLELISNAILANSPTDLAKIKSQIEEL